MESCFIGCMSVGQKRGSRGNRTHGTSRQLTSARPFVLVLHHNTDSGKIETHSNLASTIHNTFYMSKLECIMYAEHTYIH